MPTLTGSALHFSGPETNTPYTDSTTFTLYWFDLVFGDKFLIFVNDASIGTVFDAVVVYQCDDPGTDGVMRFSTDAGDIDVGLLGATTALSSMGDWCVCTDMTGVEIERNRGVSIYLKTAGSGTVYIKSISLIPRAS